MYGDEFETSIGRNYTGDLSPTTLIGAAWEHLRSKPVEAIGGFVGIMGLVYGIQAVFTIAIYALIFGAMIAVGALGEVIGPDAAGVLALIGGGFGYMTMLAAIVILQTLAMATYQLFWLKTVRGQERVNYAGVLKYSAVPLALSSVLVTAATMFGMLGFIIGAYIVMLGLMFTTTIIWDHRVGAVDAMKKSWELMRGHKLQLFFLLFVLGLFNMLGLLTCGVGMLVTAPVSAGTIAIFYDRIAMPGNAYLRV